MIADAGLSLLGQLQGGTHHIADVDERAYGVAAAMELHRFARSHAEHGAGDDPVELLSRAIDVGRPGEYHREVVGLVKAKKVEVAGGPAHRIRRAR